MSEREEWRTLLTLERFQMLIIALQDSAKKTGVSNYKLKGGRSIWVKV
jgi:hypothetical protein